MATKKGKKEDIIEMTQASYDEMVKELETRKTTQRQEIADEISEARDLGDLSENHAYTVAMEKRELNENRISDLESLLKNVQIVKGSSNTKIVTIGKTVTIKSTKTNKSRKITLAGSEETEVADPEVGVVSTDSPIGKAIYNAKVGDTVEVELPTGTIEYKIEKLS